MAMKTWITSLSWCVAGAGLFAQDSGKMPEETYPEHPDSVRREGVPRGEVTRYRFTESAIFPGTERDYWVYVPAQYDGSEPACLMVFQDGGGYVNEKGSDRVPIVFDNLIARGEMPVTIGVFVNPGVVPAPHERAQPRYNRSFEYDALTDRYARFLLDELLPEVEKSHRLSADPNDRAISGASSGAICAFNVAWQRPDAFRRVYSVVGTFVGLRGGNEFPVLIRKTEPKPLRVFLQDGSHDNNLYCGSWWVANQDMLASLEWAGYEVNHEWGEGGHNHKHGGAILPDVLRWLWRDWPRPVATHVGAGQSKAGEFLIEGEEWELVSEGHGFTEGPAVAANGDLYFSDLENGTIHRISAQSGERAEFWRAEPSTPKPAVNGLAFGPDGRLFACLPGAARVVAFDVGRGGGSAEILAEGVRTNDLVVAHDGTVYFSEPKERRIGMIRPGENVAKVAGEGFSGVNGVVLSPDQTLLYTADYGGRFVSSALRMDDGELAYAQPYFHLHTPPADSDIRGQADGMCVTTEGWLLVATAMGVQICDQPGRVQLIVPMPVGARHPSNISFGGEDDHTLYATCGDRVYRRRLVLTGAPAWRASVMPPKPRL